MNRRRALNVFLSILAVFLLGTFIVLSTITYSLSINPGAYLSEFEVPLLDNTTRWSGSENGQLERIPRIIHQTWKSETLPDRWSGISQACRDMMPDYQYMLWTDVSSRNFIKGHYPWFLETFDGYTYVIQRADAIRYFVLHHYGGIYVDLDIGCNRPLDPLLVYPVILPKTIPVGVSNDLMFAEKGHPFLEQTIHNLVTFDHSWILNYPTVMFSTGPMFLSAQYGIYTSSHPTNSVKDIRILPKSLYGKNAKIDEAPHSFFTHYYGSSWHADDAAFIGFLGKWGKILMWIGLAVLVLGIVIIPTKQRRKLRSIGRYEILLPRSSRSDRFRQSSFLDDSENGTSPDDESELISPLANEIPLLQLPVSLPPSSPTLSGSSDSEEPSNTWPHWPFVLVLRSVRRRVASIVTPRSESYQRSSSRSRRPSAGRGILFFLPAIFTPQRGLEFGTDVFPLSSRPSIPRSFSRRPSSPPSSEKLKLPDNDFEHGQYHDTLPSYKDTVSDRGEDTGSSSHFEDIFYATPSRTPSPHSPDYSRSRSITRHTSP